MFEKVREEMEQQVTVIKKDLILFVTTCAISTIIISILIFSGCSIEVDSMRSELGIYNRDLNHLRQEIQNQKDTIAGQNRIINELDNHVYNLERESEEK